MIEGIGQTKPFLLLLVFLTTELHLMDHVGKVVVRRQVRSNVMDVLATVRKGVSGREVEVSADLADKDIAMDIASLVALGRCLFVDALFHVLLAGYRPPHVRVGSFHIITRVAARIDLATRIGAVTRPTVFRF